MPPATLDAVVALPALPAVAAFKLATWVVLETTNGAVPVATVLVICPDALTVVNAPVVGVVAPTVPLILMDAVPVRFVTVPLLGVPNAPPLTTNAPALPVLTANAVATPVPNPLTPVEIGKPVAFVSVAELGVPKAGVTRVGLVAKTTLPDPVELVSVGAWAAEPVPVEVTNCGVVEVLPLRNVVVDAAD